MTILRAGLRHLDAAAELFNLYRIFYEQPSDPAGARAFVEERLDARESVIFLAQDREERYVGFVQMYPFFTSVGMRRVWVLNDLYVHQDARNQGVARALMLRVHEFARSAGALRVELATASDNTAAQALYDQLGYKRDTYYHYAFNLEEND